MVISFVELINFQNLIMYGQLSRCSAVRGSITRLSSVGSTKFKARKSFLFNEGSY